MREQRGQLAQGQVERRLLLGAGAVYSDPYS